jgi:cold shock CspA family protein
MLGTITSSNNDKGFFWCEADDTHRSYFVHISEVADRRMLHTGDRIRFEPGPNPVRPGQMMAAKVVYIGRASEKAVRS